MASDFLNLAAEAKKCIDADLVIFVPAKLSYMKKWKKYQNSDICSDDIRLRMIMTYECGWLKVDTCEMDGTVSGKSYDTIQYIKNKYHTQEVYFAIGSDKLTELPRWAMAEALISSEKFIVMQRNGDDVNSIIMANRNLARHASSFFICNSKDEYQFFSSTLARRYLSSKDPAEREKARKILTGPVWDILTSEQMQENIKETKNETNDCLCSFSS